MGSRQLPYECPHGRTLDWGDFGSDPDDGSVGAETCERCGEHWAGLTGDELVRALDAEAWAPGLPPSTRYALLRATEVIEQQAQRVAYWRELAVRYGYYLGEYHSTNDEHEIDMGRVEP